MFTGFTDAILDLERAIILHGQMAEKDVVNVMMACIEGSNELADEIIHFDDEIDKLDESITWMTQEIFNNFHPQGGDLRFLLAVPRVSANLELMGDSCVEVANYLKQLDSRRIEVLDNLNLVPQFEAVIGMTNTAVGALIDRSAKRAWRAMAILEASKRAFDYNIKKLCTNPAAYGSHRNIVFLSLICNALHVMACNASDIAANVVYITHGIDVRYQRNKIFDQISVKKTKDTEENEVDIK